MTIFADGNVFNLNITGFEWGGGELLNIIPALYAVSSFLSRFGDVSSSSRLGGHWQVRFTLNYISPYGRINIQPWTNLPLYRTLRFKSFFLSLCCMTCIYCLLARFSYENTQPTHYTYHWPPKYCTSLLILHNLLSRSMIFKCFEWHTYIPIHTHNVFDVWLSNSIMIILWSMWIFIPSYSELYTQIYNHLVTKKNYIYFFCLQLGM